MTTLDKRNMSRVRERIFQPRTDVSREDFDSLPAEPLDRDVVLAVNESDADMVVLPVSDYQKTKIFSMALLTDDSASVGGFDGDQWIEITNSRLR